MRTHGDGDSLELGDDVDGASRVLDLADLPLGASLMQMAALAFRNNVLQAQANQEFQTLQAAVADSLTSPEVGHLMEVSLYSDEFGNVAVPSGQLLYSMGIGTEPLDALAENLRHPQLRAGNPALANLRNNSFFVWVRHSDGKLLAQTIAPEFRSRFLELGEAEARRRELLGAWRRALPHDPYESIARAEYWADVERTKATTLADKRAREAIESLVQSMRETQAAANDVLRRFRDAELRMQEQANFLSVLQGVSSLAALFKAGQEAYSLVCTLNGAAVAGGNTQPEANQSETVGVVLQIREVTAHEQRDLAVRLQESIEQIRKLDLDLDRVFKEHGIPLPDRGPILP